jgi:hypothetical protein
VKSKITMDVLFPGGGTIPRDAFCRAVLGTLLGNFVGEPTAVMLHRSVFSRFGYFNPHLVQICDLEYWIRVGSNSGLVYVPETLAHFRRHGGATTVRNERSNRLGFYFDQVICFHDFVFHPLYASLRFYASRSNPPVNLRQYLAAAVKEAQKLAKRAFKDPAHPYPEALKQFRNLTLLFPGIRMVRKIPFSLRLPIYRLKIRRFLSELLKGKSVRPSPVHPKTQQEKRV